MQRFQHAGDAVIARDRRGKFHHLPRRQQCRDSLGDLIRDMHLACHGIAIGQDGAFRCIEYGTFLPLRQGGHLRLTRSFLDGDGRMGVPFILRAIDRRDAANYQFAQLAGKG